MSRNLQLQVILGAVDRVTAPLKSVTKTTKQLKDAYSNTRGELRELQDQHRDVTAYRKARAELRSQNQALDKLRTRATSLTEAFDKQRDANTNIKASLKTARSEFNRLSKAMMDGKGGSAEFNQELEKARTRLLVTQRESDKSSRALKRYRDRIRSTDRQLESLTRQQKSSTDRLQRYRQRLDESGISTNNLGRKSRNLRSEQERLNSVLKQQKDRLAAVAQQEKRLAQRRESAQRMHGLGMSIGAHGAGALYGGQRLLRGMAGAISPGISFGEQMSELQSVSRLDKNSALFQALQQQARDLGGTTQFTATDVAGGQTFLARAGFSPQAIRASMRDMLDMALANNTELARTADIASNIAGAFKIDPEQAGNMTRVADVLSGTAARANVDLEMMGETMQYLAGLRDLDITLEQAATLTGLLGNVGIQGSMAGTTIREMINRLTDPSREAAEIMEQLGLNVADAEGNMRPLPAILRDLTNATRSMGNARRKAALQTLFGSRAGTGTSELVSQMAEGGLDELLAQLQDLRGENERMADIRADNIGGDLKNLRSAWEDIGISLSETNEGPLRDTLQSITDVVRSVGTWIKENPALAGSIAKWTAAVLAGITALGGLAIAAGSILMVASIFKKIGLAALLLNPVFAVIALLATAAFMLWKNWDGVKGGLVAIWNDLGGSIWSVLASINGFLVNWSPLGLFYKAFAGVFEWFGYDLPDTFTEYGVQLVMGLIAGIEKTFTAVKDTITDLGSSTIGWFKEKLGIRSPSRVFATLGDQTMAGLAVGLNRSEREPLRAIDRMTRQLAASGALAATLTVGGPDALAIDNRPPLGPQERSVVVQGDTITINITAPAGADGREIARAVNQALEERERRKSIRARSALYDRQ